MTIVLFDSLTRSLQTLAPLRPPVVGVYTCGPTVYHDQHLGNYRTFLFEDGLVRTLRWHGHEVNHVMNITDVGHLTSDEDVGEDKIEKGARRTGLSAWEVAAQYTQRFVDDMAALRALPPTTLCRATEHLPEQIGYIEELVERGYTYTTDDGVYFDTGKLASYGALARLDRAGLLAGHRVDRGGKRLPTDFALWKFSSAPGVRQMEWPSPWGLGFPGWHIECSAMAERYLGARFDLHCGGEDHVMVHHPNEMAQAEARSGSQLASLWLHGSFLTAGGGKIRKSEERAPEDEFLGLAALRARGHEPLAFRYLCQTSHYRARLSFAWDALGAAETALERLRRAVAALPSGGEPHAGFLEKFGAALGHDLGFPEALALVHDLLRANVPAADRRATLARCEAALGLDLERAPEADEVPASIRALADERWQARTARDFAAADRLRAALAARGYRMTDQADGYRLERHA